MAAVWLRLRAELRTRWRSWLGVAVLAGVFGGAVVAAAAGAVRTDSVVDRNLAVTRQPDIYLVPEFTVPAEHNPELFAKLTNLELLTALPSVADGIHFRLLGNEEEIEVAATDDPRVGRILSRPVILEGRIPDPARPDEAEINFLAAERLGLKPGDTYTFHFLGVGAGSDSDQAETPRGPAVTVRITGIGASLGDLGKFAEPGFTLTPAFLERYGKEIPALDLLTLYLTDARSSGPFDRDFTELTGGQEALYIPAAGGEDQARRSFGLQAVSLWILAGFLALVTVLVLGQTIARQTFLESEENPILRALGWSRGQLVAIGMLRSAGIGAAAAVVAVVVAAGASPLAPFGRARLLDPSGGFSVHAVPMLLGFAGVLVGVLALAAYPAWRAARLGSGGIAAAQTAEPRRPSRLARAVSRIAAGPSAGIGARMALEPGRGRTAVPVRTTISGTCIALIGLTAALVIGSSLAHMRTTPRLYGWNWDVTVGVEDGFFAPTEQRALADIPGVQDVAFGGGGPGGLIDGVPADGIGVRIGDRIHPPILEGRAPADSGEIALARKTMRATGKRIGDVVNVGIQGSTKRVDLRVVGVTVLPFEGDSSALGEGFFVRIEAIRRIFDQPLEAALVRFDPTADAGQVTKRIRELFGPDSVSFADPPLAVVDFGHVSNMPYLLAGIVSLLGAGTLTHGLVTAVRRRRRDLAVLKAIGLDRGQVRRAVAWQGTATALLTVVVGVPLGVIAGRWVWSLFANQTGFLAEPVVNLTAMGAVLPATILLANLVAALPGRAAARVQPAVVLRSE